jgi:two-component system OmpR family response regulator
MHILLVEDDLQAAEYLAKGLSECGHIVDHARDGEDGLHMALTAEFDVIVMDRMLPKRDGLSVVRMLRAGGSQTPILILSALGEIDDRVLGLRDGGDDYLVKPYAFSELLARLEVLHRRNHPVAMSHILRVADLIMDLQTQHVTRSGRAIRLQPKEYRLLEYFMWNVGRVVTRMMLLEHVWDFHFDPQTNVIDVQVSRLRAKIDKGFDTPLLHTIRGVGYKLSETP